MLTPKQLLVIMYQFRGANAKKNVKKGLMPYLILLIVILVVAYVVAFGGNKVNDLTYDKLLSEIKDGHVTELIITPHSSEGVYHITGKLEGYAEKETFSTNTPLTDSIINQIVSLDEDINYKLILLIYGISNNKCIL